MPAAAHVVVTDRFGGVERYVCDVAKRLPGHGWQTTVVGGSKRLMGAALEGEVRWLPGGNAGEALASLARAGRQDVCHVHMTLAEAVGIASRRVHAAPVVSTRHFAARRGSSRLGGLLAPWIGRQLACEIAVSRFVADNLERRPDEVIPNGVPDSPVLWSPDNRVVLVAQRLEPEKDTLTALQAWHLSGLADDGWALRVLGDGSQRRMLESWASDRGVREVTFAGWAPEMASELSRAGVLLASALAEPFGLSVVEAMAAGVPVVATAAGGHLETLGSLASAPLFPPGDANAAARLLRSMMQDEARARVSTEGRELTASSFTISSHVERLLAVYESLSAATRAR